MDWKTDVVNCEGARFINVAKIRILRLFLGLANHIVGILSI